MMANQLIFFNLNSFTLLKCYTLTVINKDGKVSILSLETVFQPASGESLLWAKGDIIL